LEGVGRSRELFPRFFVFLFNNALEVSLRYSLLE